MTGGQVYPVSNVAIFGSTTSSPIARSERAIRFTAAISALPTQAVIPVDLLLSNPRFLASLLSDNNGLPGGVLDSGVAEVLLSDPLVAMAEFSGSVPLLAGQVYWLAATPLNEFESALLLNGFDIGVFALDRDESGPSDPWQVVATSYRFGATISGTPIAPAAPVPEASTFGYIAVLGLAGLAARRIRKRRA